MRSLPTRVQGATLDSVVSHFDLRVGDTLEVVVTLADESINAREFGAYLRLMDRVYGRVLKGDFRSYALTSYGQLEIAEIRKGSPIEIVVREILSQLHYSMPLLILWLFLKYVPVALKAFSEATKNVAESYKAIEEGRLATLNRKKLKDELRREEHLQGFNNTQINQLIGVLMKIETEARRTLPAATRFSRKYVKAVTIKTTKKPKTDKRANY